MPPNDRSCLANDRAPVYPVSPSCTLTRPSLTKPFKNAVRVGWFYEDEGAKEALRRGIFSQRWWVKTAIPARNSQAGSPTGSKHTSVGTPWPSACARSRRGQWMIVV